MFFLDFPFYRTYQNLARKCATKIQFSGQNHRPNAGGLGGTSWLACLGIRIGSFISRMNMDRKIAKREQITQETRRNFVLLILAVNRYFESKGQSSNRSLQCFHVLHSSTWPARMRSRDQSVLQVTLYAQASETSGCHALLICHRPRLSPPSPVASGWCRDSCVTIHSAT